MIFSELIQGFLEHKEFIFFNHLVHVFAGAFIATVIFPFLNNRYRSRYNYVLTVFFPAMFGSLFPDMMFIISTLIKNRSLTGLFDALSGGGDVYSTFHFAFPVILVIPCVVFFVLIINKIFKRKFDEFGWKGLILMSLIGLFSALLHILMDSVGF
ncbi:hypothetical protein J4223_02215 [Candidatus Woesearchaeota archaeon]|nr:hypothetical protein [Candidatus Woesearchaeota archaeon]